MTGAAFTRALTTSSLISQQHSEKASGSAKTLPSWAVKDTVALAPAIFTVGWLMHIVSDCFFDIDRLGAGWRRC